MKTKQKKKKKKGDDFCNQILPESWVIKYEKNYSKEM